MNLFIEKYARPLDYAYGIIQTRDVKKRIEADDLAYVKSILSPEEFDRFQRFSRTKRKAEFCAGRFAVKDAMHQLFENVIFDKTTIARRANGSPFILERPEWFVSISHSFDYAVALVARHPVGIDIEKIEKRPAVLVSYFCHPKEKWIYDLNSTHPQRQNELVTTWWTRKEAISKYTTLGGRMPFNRMNTIPDVYENDDPVARIRLYSSSDSDYAVTIAV